VLAVTADTGMLILSRWP